VAFFIAAANAGEFSSSAQAGTIAAPKKPIVATSRINGIAINDIALEVIVTLLPWDIALESLVPVF
jgi:hypothetical protein